MQKPSQLAVCTALLPDLCRPVLLKLPLPVLFCLRREVMVLVDDLSATILEFAKSQPPRHSSPVRAKHSRGVSRAAAR